MFTGLVQGLGEVASLKGLKLTVSVPDAWPGDPFVLGESVSINGCCLTVVGFDGGLEFDLSEETLARTTLGGFKVGTKVNLERAMKASDRFGGHIVQGHVDAVATVRSIEPSEDWTLITFDLPREIARYVVEKGSITVSGVSLTVVKVSEPIETQPWFSVSLIPTTLKDTTLGKITVGSEVNLEVDALAKYVERILAFTPVKENP
jgi:riboflavin synthase